MTTKNIIILVIGILLWGCGTPYPTNEQLARINPPHGRMEGNKMGVCSNCHSQRFLNKIVEHQLGNR